MRPQLPAVLVDALHTPWVYETKPEFAELGGAAAISLHVSLPRDSTRQPRRP
jgi:hypothetical protein